jgi:hypothetical protein
MGRRNTMVMVMRMRMMEETRAPRGDPAAEEWLEGEEEEEEEEGSGGHNPNPNLWKLSSSSSSSAPSLATGS